MKVGFYKILDSRETAYWAESRDPRNQKFMLSKFSEKFSSYLWPMKYESNILGNQKSTTLSICETNKPYINGRRKMYVDYRNL